MTFPPLIFIADGKMSLMTKGKHGIGIVFLGDKPLVLAEESPLDFWELWHESELLELLVFELPELLVLNTVNCFFYIMSYRSHNICTLFPEFHGQMNV